MFNDKKNRMTIRGSVFAALLSSCAACAWATELVYTPVNPSFGGSPLNGAVLLNSAQAQNKHKDPDTVSATSFGSGSSLDQFNNILERAVLSRLAAAATGGIIGANGELIVGTVSTDNFAIDIVDLGGGLLQVTTTDKATGASTSFQIGQ